MPSRPYTGIRGAWSSVVVTVIAELIHRDFYKWFWEFGSVSAKFGCANFVDLRNWALLAVPLVNILHTMSQATMTAEQLQQLLASMQA